MAKKKRNTRAKQQRQTRRAFTTRAKYNSAKAKNNALVMYNTTALRKFYRDNAMGSMTKAQADVVRAQLMEQRKLANSRIKHLRRAMAQGRDIYSPAYQKLKGYNLGDRATLSESKVIPLDKLLEDAYDVQAFLRDATSTTRGAVEYENWRVENWKEKRPYEAELFKDDKELRDFLRFIGNDDIRDIIGNSYESGEEVEMLADIFEDEHNLRKFKDYLDEWRRQEDVYERIKIKESGGELLSLNSIQNLIEELSKDARSKRH